MYIYILCIPLYTVYISSSTDMRKKKHIFASEVYIHWSYIHIHTYDREPMFLFWRFHSKRQEVGRFRWTCQKYLFSSTQWRTWSTWVRKRICVIWPILPHWPSDVSFLHFEITLNLLSMEYCLLKRVDTLLLPVAPARLVILRQRFHDPFVLTAYTSQVVSLQVVPLNILIFFPNQH